MNQAFLEHTNLTVSNADQTAQLFCELFDWTVRWSGAALDDGYTVHVGGKNSYLAIYDHQDAKRAKGNDYKTINNLNHLGIVVDDIASVEQRVLARGLKPFNHNDRKPGGKCFYFLTNDKLEIEVVSYANG